MSSDSDEDELLQMALQEQAQRDLNYQKPSSKGSKPVVNLVQPPPPPPGEVNGRNHHHYQQQRNPNPKMSSASSSNSKRGGGGGGGDDDDDSEVEMMSISSGDEDSSREIGIQQQRNRARRPSRDDGDRGGDDGEEPRTWKRVDEAELARRVREMRETRATPATQSIDPKAALARKGLNNLKSLPRGVEVLDPLGLGVMDNKSLRLITDASVSSPVSREKDALDPNIREKIIYSSPDFDAKVFLSRVHQETSAADLEAGALTLKTDLKGRTQQKKKLVKENFDCFVSCKNTIDGTYQSLQNFELFPPRPQ